MLSSCSNLNIHESHCRTRIARHSEPRADLNRFKPDSIFRLVLMAFAPLKHLHQQLLTQHASPPLSLCVTNFSLDKNGKPPSMANHCETTLRMDGMHHNRRQTSGSSPGHGYGKQAEGIRAICRPASLNSCRVNVKKFRYARWHVPVLSTGCSTTD